MIEDVLMFLNIYIQLNLSKCKASVVQNFCTYRATGMLKINNLVALQVQNFWTTEALHLDRFNCMVSNNFLIIEAKVMNFHRLLNFYDCVREEKELSTRCLMLIARIVLR